MKLYMAVSKDIYKLPIAVADSATELARMTGFKRSYILKEIWVGEHQHETRFFRLEIEDEE